MERKPHQSFFPHLRHFHLNSCGTLANSWLPGARYRRFFQNAAIALFAGKPTRIGQKGNDGNCWLCWMIAL
jgi:hypothetical protein